jgi:uncharacterized protein
VVEVAAYYLDSSGLVKRYVNEVGTSWVRGLTHRNAGHQIFVSRITAVEVTAAVARRRRGRTLTPPQAASIQSRFRQHLAGRYTVLELTPGLLADAMKLANTHELRAYDAVQLAAAIALNRLAQGGIVLVSADQELNGAATAEGLAVDNPNAHP